MKRVLKKEDSDLETQDLSEWKIKNLNPKMETILNDHLNLIHSIVRNYSCVGISYDELFAEGVIGLIIALDKFQPEKNFKFSTYAFYWIRSKVSNFIRKFKVNSNNKKNSESNNYIIGKKIVGDEWEEFQSYENDSIENLDINDLAKNIHIAIDLLTEKERLVIQKRFLNEKHLTLQEIADEFEMSKEGVRNIELRAVKKIKEFLVLNCGISAIVFLDIFFFRNISY